MKVSLLPGKNCGSMFRLKLYIIKAIPDFHCYTVHVVEFTQFIHQLMHLYKSYTLKN